MLLGRALIDLCRFVGHVFLDSLGSLEVLKDVVFEIVGLMEEHFSLKFLLQSYLILGAFSNASSWLFLEVGAHSRKWRSGESYDTLSLNEKG